MAEVCPRRPADAPAGAYGMRLSHAPPHVPLPTDIPPLRLARLSGWLADRGLRGATHVQRSCAWRYAVQVEVFETEDERQTADEVNKADIWKEQVRLDPETDSIETTHQSAVDAYAVFATSTALRPVGDHSGSAEAFERLRAYSVPKGSLETPLQKLERLKLETAELTATMEVAQTQGGLAAAQFPGSTAAELGELQEKLSGITRAMSSDAPVLEAMSGSTAEKLMQDLGAYSAAVDGGGKGAPAAEAGGGGGGNVTYELYLEPGSAGVALDKGARALPDCLSAAD
eukprot:SAG25_NODE_56_length_18517_cov_197.286296_5_plen_286_part_00